MSFDSEFNQVVMVEGGYSDHPSDAGGKTRYGITERVARVHGYGGAMAELPLTIAKGIYRSQYWDLMRLDEVGAVSRAIAHELFDTGVNCGTRVAVEFLQRALSRFNRRGKDYPDVEIDGVAGPITTWTLRKFLELRGAKGETAMLRALNAQQGSHYLRIADLREDNEDFMLGWFANRVS